MSRLKLRKLSLNVDIPTVLKDGEFSRVSTATPLPPASASDMMNELPPPLLSGVWPADPPQGAELGSYGFDWIVQATDAGQAELVVRLSAVHAPRPDSKS